MQLHNSQKVGNEAITVSFRSMLEHVAQSTQQSLVISMDRADGIAVFVKSDGDPAARVVGSGEDGIFGVGLETAEVICTGNVVLVVCLGFSIVTVPIT